MSRPDRRVFRSQPDVVGHRGLGKGVVDGHPENTIASLLAAAAAGVDWLEFDVSRTGDDALVVAHNPAIADGRFLVDGTAADATATGIALLDDVLAALPLDVGLNVDLKPILEDASDRDRSTVALLLPVLRRELPRRRLLVTCFDVAALGWLRHELPGLDVGALTWLDFPLRSAVPMAARMGVPVVGVHYRSFGANQVEPAPVHRDLATSLAVAHGAGLEVLAWCPGEGEVGALIAAGVDAVTVNDVPRMLPLVRSLTGRPGRAP